MAHPKDENIALHFKGLSHPRRARIYRILQTRPEAGLSFDRLTIETRYAASALVHHLREMEKCGLIRRKRKGQFVSYFLTPQSMAKTLNTVLNDCCVTQQTPRKTA